MSLSAHLLARIEAARSLDDIMLGLPDALRSHFGADRATIYAIGEDRASLVSKIRTGPQSFTQLKLPIAAHSVAGYVALSRRLLNLSDVYDEAELRTHAQDLRFQSGVDRRTGYRSREMLAAPIMLDGEVLGVVQLINNLAGGAFGREVIEGVRRLCEALAEALRARQAAAPRARTHFANSAAGLLGRTDIEAAMRTAQSEGRDIEDVLLADFGLKPAAIGRALADYFAVPYVAFHARRRRPDALLERIGRADAGAGQWLPLGATRHSLFAVCVDPEQAKSTGAVRATFPHLKPVYCVTTRREFDAMLDQFFGGASASPELPETRRTELLDTVAMLVAGSARQGLSNLRIDTQPGEREGEIRFTVSGTLRLS